MSASSPKSSAAARIGVVIAAASMGLALSAALATARVVARTVVALMKRRERKEQGA
jgi:hypothetical protein